jgi:hypothetical protein
MKYCNAHPPRNLAMAPKARRSSRGHGKAVISPGLGKRRLRIGEVNSCSDERWCRSWRRGVHRVWTSVPLERSLVIRHALGVRK